MSLNNNGIEDYEFVKKIDIKKKYLVFGFIKEICNTVIPQIVLSKCLLYYAYYNPAHNIIMAVGNNWKGQFGTGDAKDIPSLTKLQWSIGLSINKIICSFGGARFLTLSNHIYLTGHNDRGQLGLNHTIPALLPIHHPFFVDKLKVVNTSHGTSTLHSYFICANGSIYTTGKNANGQLGLGNTTQYNTPQKLTFFANNNINIISIGCTFRSSLFLTANGEVYSCGENTMFQLGYETNYFDETLPKKIISLKDIILIQCGEYHSYCLSKNGIVYSFGDNRNSQLGVYSFVNKLAIHKISWFMEHNKFITRISAGQAHAAAVDLKGNIFVWGKNSYGQIGNGTTSNSCIPVQVDVLNNMEIIDISCGAFHTIVLTGKKVLYCWGSNSYNECSSDSKSNILSPNEYYENDCIQSVYAGWRCTLILINPP